MTNSFLDYETFAQRCANRKADGPGFYLLVLCLRDLPKLSWKYGLETARLVAQRVDAVLAEMSGLLLRDGDCIVHDGESEWYGVALLANGRGGRPPTAVDARAVLMRLCAALERETELSIDSGHACVTTLPASHDFVALFEDALRRGARERERYAFFSIIGHELRTPLTSIRGYLETLLDGDLDPTATQRFTEIAYRETLRIERIIQSLFHVSMLDLRSAPAERVSCSLQGAIEAATLATTALRDAHGTRLILPVACDISIPLAEDALTQVLINLIENAVKHGKPGGEVSLTLDADDARFIELCIEDDGPGVDPKDRGRIFEIGERGSSSAEGSGIGLGVVRLFVERAGGAIAVGDGMLGGAAFRITIPRV